MTEKIWQIKDGKIPDIALKIIKEQKGNYVLSFKRRVFTRTDAQNKALHLYFKWVADALNESGQGVTKFIKPGIDMMWTEILVKELLWRTTQKALFGKKSTKQLDKQNEIDQIYDVLNKAISERTGQHVPFPGYEY